MRGVHEAVRGAQPRVKSSMVEPNLYGYYKIGEDCFLVKSEVLEGGRALHMLKFIDHVHPEEESIIPDAIKHVPSLILDRRSEMSIGVDELSSSGVPINAFHSLLFRRRERVYLKGMTNVYRISHEYLLDESEPREVERGSFPLNEYSSMCDDSSTLSVYLKSMTLQNSFLNVMLLRHAFRVELSSRITDSLRVSRGKNNVSFRMCCTPDQAFLVFGDSNVQMNVRQEIEETSRSLRVVDPPRTPRVRARVTKVVADITQPQMLCDLLGHEYFRYIIAGEHYEGDVAAWDRWRNSHFSTICPLGHKKFTFEYDLLSCALRVNADASKQPESRTSLDYHKYEDDHKQLLLGKRFFDVDKGSYIWVVDVVYAMDEFCRKGRRKNRRQSIAALVAVCASEDESCFNNGRCMLQDGSRVNIDYFTNVMRERHCFPMDVKCFDSASGTIPGGKRCDGSKEIIERPMPEKKKKRHETEEHLRGLRFQRKFLSLMNYSMNGLPRDESRRGVCIAYFCNYISHATSVVKPDAFYATVEEAILRFDAYSVDEWVEFLGSFDPTFEDPGEAGYDVESSGRGRGSSRKSRLRSIAKSFYDHVSQQ